MSKIAIFGYGTIGSGVVEVLNKKRDYIKKQAGEEISVKYVLDLRDFPGDPIEKILVHDVQVILSDPEVDIVVEVMGGVHPAYEYVKSALLAGKSAVTSNKALVAACGPELLKIARERNLNFQFEASVGGGIPIIRPLYSSLTAGDASGIYGILNGTTNFMLTKMFDDEMSYEDALAQAQALGYAERDPSADVEGFDACRKIAILASVASGRFVDYQEIPTRGIVGITQEDMAIADLLGYGIKLIARFSAADGKNYAEVTPMLVPFDHALYPVKDVFNGILVDGDVNGAIMFYGSGAGKLPTAGAVVSDIIDITKNSGRTIQAGYSAEKLELADLFACERVFYVRVAGAAPSDDAARAFASSFGASSYTEIESGTYAFITEPMTRAAVDKLCADATGSINIIPVID
ncbi:MAG: homoserine dehydrogenase [Lachnospiraceae bacterium]|nr:homoserine dehydrogenase [Lachnospiraceae bacterium]